MIHIENKGGEVGPQRPKSLPSEAGKIKLEWFPPFSWALDGAPGLHDAVEGIAARTDGQGNADCSVGWKAGEV